MPRRRWLSAALLLGLALSLAGNLGLERSAYDYYVRSERLRLDPLGLVGAPFLPPPPAPAGVRTVVIFGDSRAEAWPAPADLPGYRFVNRGIGGQTTAQVLHRVDAHLAPLRPDVVVIQVGVNDLKAIGVLPEERAALVAQARALGATVVLTTVIPLSPIRK